EAELEEACRMTRLLIDWKDLGTPPNPDAARQFESPRLRKAWRMIALLRSFYPDLIQSDRAPYQMHVGLMRYAMHTLSFDESSALQRKWALFSGALCADLIRNFVSQARRLRVDFLGAPGRAGR